jgi:hypothetical protein
LHGSPCNGRMFGKAQALLQRLLQVGFNAPSQIVNILADFYKDGRFSITPEVFDMLNNACIKLESSERPPKSRSYCKFLD